MNDGECIRFLQFALPRLGLRWPGFRKVRKQACKRISRRMRELGLADCAAYIGYLEDHPNEWQALDAMCRISISRFYRDKGVYDALRDDILPALADGAGRRGDAAIRIWSAGCASGEEPYTLALLWALALAPRYPEISLDIIATDADRRLLERAERGVYPGGCLKELPREWVAAAFEECGGEFRLRQEFRAGVTFLCQDIREQFPDGAFDLILCRNLVFTYFDMAHQQKLLDRLVGRLRAGGYLVIGAHEKLREPANGLTLVDRRLPIYRCRPAQNDETCERGAA